MSLAADADVREIRPSGDRWELYRLLGEPVRLRLLALVADEELTVGELADLLGEAQPNVSRHAAPLRQLGLVTVRKQGTRVLMRLSDAMEGDAVVADAIATGRALCDEDGSLARVAEVVRARDAASRVYFARAVGASETDIEPPACELGAYLAALGSLLTARGCAVDAGTGDGGLLDVLAPVFEHVVAFDREEAQLARCAGRVEQRAYRNVTLVRSEVDGDEARNAVAAYGGADAVFAARLLHHAPRPADAVRALAALLRDGGALVVLDYARHEDEAMREEADLWLGFDVEELVRFARGAGLVEAVVRPVPLPALFPRKAPRREGRDLREPRDAHLRWQLLVARRPIAARDAEPPRTQLPKSSTSPPALSRDAREGEGGGEVIAVRSPGSARKTSNLSPRPHQRR